MEHSRLLKFLVPERRSKMAEPVKVKFDYQNPENVESEVPGAQKLREPEFEELANSGENSTIGESSKEREERRGSVSGSSEVPTRPERRHVLSGKRNGIHGEPVLLDKQDVKSKTKIPVSRFRQTVEKVREEKRKTKREQGSHIPVRRSSIPKPVKENKTPPITTKIDREITVTKTIVKKTLEPVVTKTVITKETTTPHETAKHVETTVTKTEIETETIEPEDEFDKIYAEIVNTPSEAILDENLLNPKVEDPEKLESKFEEIIHDYEEHKVEPIDVEVVRRSKVPLLSRKSQQEIELSAQAERTSKIIAARDKLRLRYSMSRDENFEEALDKELHKININSNNHDDNKDSGEEKDLDKKDAAKVDTKSEKEIKYEVISSPNSKIEITEQFTKTVSTSSTNEQENIASSGVVETTTINEISINKSNENKESKQHYITEENIMKGAIKIGIPVFDSFVQESSEINETANNNNIKNVLSFTSTNEELSVTNNTSEAKNELFDDIETNEAITLTKKIISVSKVQKGSETKFENTDLKFENQIFKNEAAKVDSTTYENAESVQIININSLDKTEHTQKPTKIKENIYEGVQLRNNVEKIINKIDSREIIETEGSERESINELRKKKSVLSKIAMFENKPEDAILPRAPKRETKLPKLITKDQEKSEHIHVHTPLIVDEMFKPFTTDLSLSDIGHKDEIVLKDNDVTTFVRAKQVTVENSDTVHYTSENRVHIEKLAVQLKSTETHSNTSYEKPNEIYPTEGNKDFKNIMGKVEMTTLTNQHEEQCKGNNLAPSKSDADNFEIKYIENKYANLSSADILREVNSVKVITPTKSIVDNFEFKEYKNKATNQTKLVTSRKISSDYNTSSPKSNTNKFEFKDVENRASYPAKLRISRGISYDNEIVSPATKADKFEYKEDRIKAMSPTRLSVTKELQPPVVIPGFKTVSELLKSFESKRDTNRSFTKRRVSKDKIFTKSVSKVELESAIIDTSSKVPKTAELAIENKVVPTQISHTGRYKSEIYDIYDDFESINDYKSLDDVFMRDDFKMKTTQNDNLKSAKSLADLDLGDAVKGKVNNMIVRMKSVEKIELDKRETINKKEMPRKRSVSEKIALFEGKLTPSSSEPPLRVFKADMPEHRTEPKPQSRTAQNVEVPKYRTEQKEIKAENATNNENNQEVIQKIEELSSAKNKYEKVDIPEIELSNGMGMPVIALGTALLDSRLIRHIVAAAIDLGYRAIDTAFIYGNEKEVGEAIRAKIADGTVKREDLFIISKLWSTFHRTDLVEGACRASLEAMGLDYFDLYLVHNPMSFKEGGSPLPKIATVIQYSEHDYLDAWYGMEPLVAKGLVRAIGVSNFNSLQLQRVLDKGRIKPVVNQVECHPYLSQQRLNQFCSERNVTLSCFGTLGSKGTPLELKNGQPAAIDDALVQVMASGLGITPAQLLISYQLESGHAVVVKGSSARHLHDNQLATRAHLTAGQVDALHALNRNKRMFTFKGMGDTHKNYPFNAAF